MLRVLTSWYDSTNEIRRSEILQCLQKNLANPAVDEVCLLLENTNSPVSRSKKLTTKLITSRPTYQEFFDWANECSTSPDDVSIVCNSDIYFDRSIEVFKRFLRPNQCVALSRWETDETLRLYDHNDSQDSWVFRGKIRNVASDFLIGVPRCDNRMLYELRQAKYAVINPAFSVRSYHVHAGERAPYADGVQDGFVEPPYGYLWPHNLYSWPATVVHNWKNPKSPLFWQFDHRRWSQTFPSKILKKLRSLIVGVSRESE